MITGQGIETKFLGLTNFRGERIKAMAWFGSKTIRYRSELTPKQNHINAAEALLESQPLNHLEIKACAETKDGYCFVLFPKDLKCAG